MEKVNLCGFSDILLYGERNFNIPYNQMHTLLVDLDIYEDQVYVEEIENNVENYSHEYNEDQLAALKVVIDFAKHHKVTEFHIAPKNW